MKFTQVETNENLNFLCYRSESGEWEIGVYRVIYGMRVGVSNLVHDGYELQYCAGDNWLMVIFMLYTLIDLFSAIEDDHKTVLNFCHSMPRQYVKPIREGDDLFNALMTLSLACKRMSNDESEEPQPSCASPI